MFGYPIVKLKPHFDLAHCRLILKKHEEISLDDIQLRAADLIGAGGHPTQYFVHWLDPSTFRLSVIRYQFSRVTRVPNSSPYSPVARFQVAISGTPQSPILTVQRKVKIGDWLPKLFLMLFLTTAMLGKIFHANGLTYLKEHGGLYLFAFSALVFWAAWDIWLDRGRMSGYSFLKEILQAEEIS